MKQKTSPDFTILLLAIVFIIALLSSCNDKETPVKLAPLRDYQIEVMPDSIYLFDGKREVGAIPFGNTAIDSLIMKDNQ